MIMFTHPSHYMGFMFRHQKGNVVKYVVVHEILTDVCERYFLPWTLYSWSVHLRWLAHFIYLPWSTTPFLCDGSKIFFWNPLARLMSLFAVEVCITICVSYASATVSCTLVINMEINCFSVSFKTSTTYLTCPGDPTPKSMITFYTCAKLDSKYSAVAHLCCSVQPYLFPHIVLRSTKISCLFFNS